MQSETGFPNNHQLKSYVASKSRLKFAARAVLSADAQAGLLVVFYIYGMYVHWHQLENTTEPTVCGGDAALCQIALTACYYYYYYYSGTVSSNSDVLPRDATA